MTASDAQLAAEYRGCLATSARLIDRVVGAAYDAALRDLGIRATQVTLLVQVAALGRPTAAQLAPAMRIDQTTLSRNLARLEGMGLIRSVEGTDGRTAPVELTREGRALLRKALPRWREGQRRLRAALGDDLAGAIVAGAAALREAP